MSDVPQVSFQLEEEVCFLLVRAAGALDHRFSELMAREALTPRQFALLAQLSTAEALTTAELARRLEITAQSAGPQIDALAARELVERDPEPLRARGAPVNVRLTPVGRATFDRAARLARTEQLRLTGHLEPREYAWLAEQLRTVARRAAEP